MYQCIKIVLPIVAVHHFVAAWQQDWKDKIVKWKGVRVSNFHYPAECQKKEQKGQHQQTHCCNPNRLLRAEIFLHATYVCGFLLSMYILSIYLDLYVSKFHRKVDIQLLMILFYL